MQPGEKAFFSVVGIAASAGGFTPLIDLISGLPGDFPAPVLVVLHTSPDYISALPTILGRQASMRVKEAENGEKLSRSTVYTAKPDRHLVVNQDGTLSLNKNERVQFVRPAADVLFISMAISCREKAIAVILSGGGQDGAIGSLAVKMAGGKTIAQMDPEVPGMPASAIKVDDVDFIMPLAEIAPLLVNLVTRGSAD